MRAQDRGDQCRVNVRTMTDGDERQHSLFEYGESIPAASNEYLTCLRKLDALLISLEDRKSNTALQLSNLLAQCRLGDL